MGWTTMVIPAATVKSAATARCNPMPAAQPRTEHTTGTCTETSRGIKPWACDGKRRWIRRVETRELSYSSSPALADGTLAVFLDRLVGSA